MDGRSHSFLTAIVGADAAAALAKAAVTPALAWAVVPRAAVAWIQVQGDVAGPLPGVPDSAFELRKSTAGYSGSVTLGDGSYAFADASVYHAAAAVALAVAGAPGELPPLPERALTRLGKALDQLVKARAAGAPKAPRAEAPGAAAAATEPKGPETPEPPVPTQRRPGAKKPALKPKLPTLRVTKSEAAAACRECGRPHFAGPHYVGCACFAGLAKAALASVFGDSFMLSFSAPWDADAVFALADTIKDRHGR